MRPVKRVWPAAALLLAPAPADAGGPDAQRLRVQPALDDHAFATPSARPVWDRPWSLGLILDHADDPVLALGDGVRDVTVVDSQTTLHLLAAWRATPRLQLGLEVPVVVHQNGDAPATLQSVDPGSRAGLADLRLAVQYTLFTTETRDAPHGFSLALGADAFAPTGADDRYQGEGLRGGLQLLADFALRPALSIGGAVGYRFRESDRLVNVQTNDEVTYAAALHVGLGSRWEVVPEAQGAAGVLTGAPEREELPREALLGLRFLATPRWALHAGGGYGLVGGFGNPRWRLLGGLTFRAGDDPEARHRQIAAAAPLDQCPDLKEDFDGFEDSDGCPDTDDDRDGVPDTADDCRLGAEDRDGFEDDDGCADPDDDRDGFPDGFDRCPRDPEDHDGVDDGDGCPEADDDADRARDLADRCPVQPETENGFRDADGCPDEKPLPIDCDGFELGADVLFESGKATLLARSLPMLDEVARSLVAMPEIRRIRLEGFTDDQGGAAANLDLSQRRVDEVRARLLAGGVAPERIEARGFGEERPVAPNTTPAGRARNRRVELVVVERAGCAGR